MDYKKISEECPKAWEKYGDWESKKYLYPTVLTSTRDLYDFFDAEGILINVSWDSVAFDYQVSDLDFVGSHNYKQDNFGTRTECESSAFAKAFQILEQRL